MTQSKHAFKIISVLKALLEGKEVSLGNISYRTVYINGDFQFQYYWMENWHDTELSLEHLIKRAGYLTDEEIMEINVK